MKKLGLFCMVCLLLAACSQTKKIEVTVTNPSDIDRTVELVEIPWQAVAGKLGLADGMQVVVTDPSGRQLPYQLVKNGEEQVQSLLFPATVGAWQSVVYSVAPGTPETFSPHVYGRFVPERKDDFAWENDRAAFRMYGPALQATGEISNGIDLWVKKTGNLVIDKWYKDDLAGVASYHADHGEGLDCYKVGRTLGLGALAPFANDTIWLGNNFVKYEVLDNGPLRVTFRLTYAPFDVAGEPVAETRTISLDAGNQLNKVVEHFDMQAPRLAVASGIVLRPEEGGVTAFDAQGGYAAYAEPETADGIIYAAMVSPASFTDVKTACGHLLALGEYEQGAGYTYYTGGGWSRAGFETPESWFAYVKDFAARVQQPLTVKVGR
ncbi:MAG: DUF4861 domain-containing protein [Parabacteroides sp.]|nr:DUF4861 domain-containing protein [Parabacteroides sp.]